MHKKIFTPKTIILKALLLIVFCLATQAIYAQNARITGTIKNAVTRETLIGVTLKTNTGEGTVTDIDGNYLLSLPAGLYQVSVTYIGYKPLTVDMNIASENDNKVFNLDLEEDNVIMKEVSVTADVARSRQTPVAFTTIPLEKIREEIATQDLPMVLNSTPGVYATQQGGGDGDSRITIRGFDQRNIAILIDGVPVNDMENGWVYWSNWSGLSEVARSLQVQRGLGASKLALPSVGGTLNLLTKGIEAKSRFSVTQEIGTQNHLKTVISGTTGRLKNGFGITFTASYKNANGWVDNTWSKAGFYFFKIEKQLNSHHTLGFSVVGAPQKHGQRVFKQRIANFSKAEAVKMFDGTDAEYNLLNQYDSYIEDTLRVQKNNGIAFANNNANYSQAQKDSAVAAISNNYTSQLNEIGVNSNLEARFDQTYIDTSKYKEYGIKYNSHWGELTRKVVNGTDTTNAKKENVTERLNYYHKPQFLLKHFWTANSRFSLSNMLYLSLGDGGGTQNQGSGFQPIFDTGLWNYQQIYDNNFNRADGKSTNILKDAQNNHIWYGYLSTFDFQQNDRWSYSGGLDLRYYKGNHVRRVYDLLGGDYYVDAANPTVPKDTKVYENGIIERDYDGLVKWGGAFGQIEYATPRLSAFLNLTGAMTSYQRIDRYAKRDLVLADTTLLRAIGYTDTVTYNGSSYNFSSPETRVSQTSEKIIPGFTIKTGANFNLDEHQNVYFNTGYISKAPRFDNVFNAQNIEYPNIINEKIAAGEIGYGVKFRKFSLNANTYYTVWINRPLIATIINQDGNDEQRNVAGLKAHHRGLEIDYAYDVLPNKLKWEGLLSLGDWVWKTDTNTVLLGDEDIKLKIPFSANNVHVGDAAQFQVAQSLRYQPFKNSFIKVKGTYFGKNYSEFTPERLTGTNQDREVWKIPNYFTIDLYMGYNFNITRRTKASISLNILNALDNVYISDGSNRIGFRTRDIEVFYGAGRRGSISTQINF